MNTIVTSSNQYSPKYIILTIIGVSGIGLFLRVYYFPFNVPLTFDSLDYFFYAMDISKIGVLPSNYTPINNGWPIFLSSIFSVFSFEKTISYMELQRFLSILFSVFTIIPIYYLCRKFVGNAASCIGSTIFVLEPRILQNSLFGITDSVYIFLIAVTLTLFLNEKTKIIYAAFVMVGFASLVRSEGLFLFFALSVMFFIKNRKDKLVILKFLPALLIFSLILLPIILYRIDITGTDGLFIRVINSTANQIISSETGIQSKTPGILIALENFPKYLGWDLIPIFIFFVPIGIILIFRKINYKKLTIIISLFSMSLPALYAYSLPIQETRFFYFLYPLFCVLSVLTVELFLNKFHRKNMILIFLICGILLASGVFLSFKMADPQYERDAFLIAKYITVNAKGVNDYYPEHNYLETAEIPEYTNELSSYFHGPREKLVSIRYEIPKNTKIIPIGNSSSLKDYIMKGQKSGLTHLVLDGKEKRSKFLNDVYYNDNKYSFLIKKFDSEKLNYSYKVKIFEIDYSEFNSTIS